MMLRFASPFNSPSKSRKKPAAGCLCKLKERSADEGSKPSPAIAIQPKLLQVLHGSLCGDGPRTIGILGPAGAGKTTILKALNYEILRSIRDKESFHPVIFAPASRVSNPKRLQAIIARRLNLPRQENESKEITAIRISTALREKKFLLLLDDLQRPLHLEEIGIPLPCDGRNKSMLIFTTRSESVCNKMNADHKAVVVKSLGSEESLNLFLRCAGRSDSSPEIIDVARSFARECGGLALALITVGRSLASTMRQTREDWMRHLQIFNRVKKKVSSIRGIESTILISSFYFSYTMLTMDQRNCLLYCSFYPKNHSIKIEELIRYWMGEGLFSEEQDSIDGARREGSEVISKLKSLGMLEDGDGPPDSEVVMHDIMHDLASRIIEEEEFRVVQQVAGRELVKVNKNMVSLMKNAGERPDHLPARPHLQSLILRKLPLVEIKNDSSLFKHGSSLGLLDLSHTLVRKIPSEIGNLVLLRYLDLSFTKIKVLPREIGDLVNLEQLLLEGTGSLASIPGGIIRKLSKILALNMYASYGDWEVGTAEAAAASIEELECLKRLNELGITICSTRALKDFLGSSGLPESTRHLLVNECEDLNDLHLSRSSFGKLQRVTIADCGALEKLTVGGNNSSGDGREDGDVRLSNLEALRLKGLYKAEIVWRGVSSYSDFLPKLREVDISYCNELTNVSWVLQLGCLESMKLDSCKKIEHVVNVPKPGGSTAARFFPRLETMTLRNLPRLKSISDDDPLSFSRLDSVKVLGCPQLRRLPESTDHNDSNPVFIFGEMEWWNALEWSSGEEQRWCFRATKENY